MKLHTALMLTLILCACGQAENNGAASGEALEATVTEAADAAVIAPADLEGQWCYTHYVAGDEKVEEMINYIFSKDGSLLYQTSGMSEIDEPGSYVIDGNAIKILPALSAFNMQFVSMSPDEFILKMAFGEMYWSRGACQPQAI